MSIKENIKVHFLDKDKIREERLMSSRILFMFSAFIFFLNLFLVWANYYEKILSQFLSYTFSFFILILYIYICLMIKHFFKDRIYNLLYFIICFIIFLLFIIALFPFIIDWGIKWFINF